MDKNKLYTAQRRAYRHKFYKTGVWVRIRKIQLGKSPLCEHCEKKGKLKVATVCDHQDPSWESWQEFISGPFNSLCMECHKLKTYFDLQKIRKAQRTKMEVLDV